MKNFILLFFALNFFNAKAQKVGDIFTTKSSSIQITWVKNYDARADNSINATTLVPYIIYEITSVSANDIEFHAIPLRSNQPSAIPMNYKNYKMEKTDYARVIDAKGEIF